MDRISELPPEILHQILSLLPTKTAARTAVLSKPWPKACSTNPNLCFDESDFEGRNNGRSVEIHGRFVRFVNNTLERYRRENLPISTFKLCIKFYDQTDCDGLVDKWLGILAEKRVSHVALSVKGRSGYYSDRYSLLADTIFSVESLQHLELNHCKILLKQKPLLFGDSTIKCRDLKSLSLHYVSVSESTLDSLISCCGSHIMTILLHDCSGFNCFCVSNLPNLSSLSILCCPIEEVDVIDAPDLESFEYMKKDQSCPSTNGKMITLSSLNIGTCQNLRKVELFKIPIIDEALFQLIQKLLFIKELSLRCCEYLKNIKISSSTLKVCSIAECSQLVQAIFDVPKLLSLAFSGRYRQPSLSFVSASTQCRISINYVYSPWNVDQFMHLRRSLVELNDLSVDLTWGIGSFLDITGLLRATIGVDHLPTPEVENFIISDHEFYSSRFSLSTYFDAIFWTCSPKSLTVLQCSRRFRKFLRKQLLNKCYSRLIKCTWKEYLINARIEYKKKIGDDWVTLDRKMLATNPSIIKEIHAIRFKQIQRKEKNKESSISRCIPRWRSL